MEIKEARIKETKKTELVGAKFETICSRRRVNRVTLQVPMEEEITLDRQMPDLDHVIGQHVWFMKEKMHTGDEKATIQGSLLYQLLYAPTGGGSVQALKGSVPVSQSIMTGKTAGKSVELAVKVTTVSVKRLNSRKLSLFAVLDICGEIYEECCQEYVRDIEEPVEKKFVKMPYSRFLQHKTAAMSLKECVSLPENKPDVERLLFENVELMNTELLEEDGRLRLKGELAAFFVYETPEQTREYGNLTVPVEEYCDFPREMEGAILNSDYTVVSAEAKDVPNEDGQKRDIILNAEVEIRYDGYRADELTFLSDAYGKEEKLCITAEDTRLVKTISTQKSRIPVEEQLSPAPEDRFLEIYPVGAVLQLEEPEVTEGGIVVEGMVVCSLLYLGMENGVQPVATELSVPFHHQLAVNTVSKEELQSVSVFLDGKIAGLSAVIVDGTTAKIHAGVNITATMLTQETCPMVARVEKEPYEEGNEPGMVGYIFSENDSLWEIAKENRTTIGAILKINQLTEQEVKPGTALLVCRKL